MAGTARIVFGVLFLLLGLFFFITIVGFILGIFFLLVGVLLLASGASARSDYERIQAQQVQTNYLLQQQLQAQLQANAMQAARPPAAASAAPGTAPLPERYCPACGGGNSRSAAFCQRCGKPLPPPS